MTRHISFLNLQLVNSRMHDEMLAAMDRVLQSGWYLNGRELANFERRFSEYVGAEYAVGVANGFDALTLILMAMKDMQQWEDGDEVIVPALTFIATAEAVSRAGLTPVFADVDDNFVMTAATAKQVVSARTKALMPVHLYGRMAPMGELTALARENGWKVVEDAAQAHGATDGCHRAGSTADAAGFSFYPGKNLGALGNGGIVTTNSKDLALRVRTLANYGAPQKYHHEYLGLNSRLDELQSALLDIRLSHLEADNQRRREIAAMYSQGIKNALVEIPYGGDTSASVFHIYPLCTPHRDALACHMQHNGIETLVHYPLTIPQQKAYAAYRGQHFPNAERAASCELSLPVSPVMTDDEVNVVIKTLNTFSL